MPSDVGCFLSAFCQSALWFSPSDLPVSSCGSSAAGLDVIWYYRRWRHEFGDELSADAIAANYLKNVAVDLRSPNLAFDEGWYRQRYPDVNEAIRFGKYNSAWEHYLREGARNGYNPAFWFDERWYRRECPEASLGVRRGTLVCGFEHYLREGVHTGLLPSMYFNSPWYADRYLPGNPGHRIAIRDYLSRDRAQRPTPVPFFDDSWYRSQYHPPNGAPDFLSAYEHYIFIGRSRGHSASPHFNESAYRTRYPHVVKLIAEGRYASGLEHYAVEGIVNGYLSSSHLGSGGLDYRSPRIVHSYEKSLTLSMRQVAQIRGLLDRFRDGARCSSTNK
jgi:hypothetical protein